jgi:hypothetical protein
MPDTGGRVPACFRLVTYVEIGRKLVWVLSGPGQTEWRGFRFRGENMGGLRAMERRHIKHETSFEERLATKARQLREQAKALPPGVEREELIRKARHAETASRMSEWLRSPECRAGFPLKGTAMRDYRANIWDRMAT